MTTASLENAAFPRANRLTTKAAYSAVFDEQQKVSQPWLLALYKKNASPHPRLGLIVAKSVLKKAPERHRLKRLLREGFRQRKAALSGLDLVILARRGLTLANKNKLKRELASLWETLSALQTR